MSTVFLTSLASELEQQWENQLRRYAGLLAAYGAARLTGTRDAGEIYNLHIKDSIYSVTLLPEAVRPDSVKPVNNKVIDVGSGGGLPGMVWAICRPDLDVTLLDSVRKKCLAMSEFAGELGLKNVSVVWSRCEEHAIKERESYAFASARALAHAGVVAEYLSPLTAVGGRIAAFKGPKGLNELEEAANKWKRLGLSDPNVVPYGDEDRNYFFAVWEKISPTPRAYPRKAGAADKKTKNWWD